MPRAEPEAPAHPTHAVGMADPYPYYAGLRARGPMLRDEASGVVLATTSAAVRATLAAPQPRVRPPGQPVPPAIEGSPAGAVFGRLVRMTDGQAQAQRKTAIVAAIAGCDPEAIAADARSRTRAAVEASSKDSSAPPTPTDLAFRIPVETVAALCGFPTERASAFAALVGRFVGAISPIATPAEVEDAKRAAAALLDETRALWRRPGHGLAHALADALDRARPGDEEARDANVIGLMSQTYDATAGLVGNALVALARHPDVAARLGADPGLAAGVVREAARHDAAIQNTRRVLADAAEIAGWRSRPATRCCCCSRAPTGTRRRTPSPTCSIPRAATPSCTPSRRARTAVPARGSRWRSRRA